MRPWHFAVVWVGLFVAAIASGVELLSYLSYLLFFVGAAMWITARLTLEDLSIKRIVGQAYAHLGDRIDLNYELRNDHRFGKLWVEVTEQSNWPEPLTGRVLSIAGHGAVRRWKVSVPRAIRSASSARSRGSRPTPSSSCTRRCCRCRSGSFPDPSSRATCSPDSGRCSPRRW